METRSFHRSWLDYFLAAEGAEGQTAIQVRGVQLTSLGLLNRPLGGL
jgi:hypothetical protein